MAKIDKEYVLRMEGMMAACDIVRKGGLEALEKDIKYRGITQSPATISTSRMGELFAYIGNNVYCNVLTIAGIVLHEKFGFGKKRLHDFALAFKQSTQNTMDIDYIGEHYVSLEDYGNFLKDELGMDINIATISMCQELADGQDPNIGRVKLDRVIEELKIGKFNVAASYLEKRFGGLYVSKK